MANFKTFYDNVLSKDIEDTLTELGFKWNRSDRTDNFLRDIRNFKNKYNHLRIPVNFTTSTGNLYNWFKRLQQKKRGKYKVRGKLIKIKESVSKRMSEIDESWWKKK